MRPDMFKVIVERERRGGGRAKIKSRRVSADSDLPEREGIKWRFQKQWELKELNENLNPLWRFLLSRINRPWVNVHSEIASQLDTRSVVKKHVLDHLYGWVELDPRFDAMGNALYAPHNASRRWITPKIRHGFYVDRKGYLRYVGGESRLERRGPWKARANPDEITIGGRLYRRINGAWFAAWTERRPWFNFTTHTWTEHDIEKRRQLSKKELRDLDLPRATPERSRAG